MPPVSQILTAFISPVCYAVSNILDSQFGHLYHDRIAFLIAQTRVITLLLALPVIAVVQPDLHVGPQVWVAVTAVSLLEFFYVYPYFAAFRHTDTSIVIALFSLGKIILPLLAWLFLGEALRLPQYIGFFLILFATVLLTFNGERFHINRTALLMLVASLMLSASNLISKAVFLHDIPWFSFAVLGILVEGALGALTLLLKPKVSWMLIRQTKPTVRVMFGLEAVTSGVGNLGFMLALSLLPLTVVKGISSTQPIFVLLYSGLLGKHFPYLFNESKSGVAWATKLLAFALTILGTVLTL